MSSIFGKIISGELPADKVFENEHLIAIKDIHPVAPVHLLIIPKKVFKDLQALKESDLHLVGEVVKVAQHLAEQFGIADGYRLLTNVGPDAGQSVFHLHFHLLGGRQLSVLG